MSDDLEAELLSLSSRNSQDTGAKKSLDDDESSDSMFSEDDSVSDVDDSSQEEELGEEELAGMSELQREQILAKRFQKQKSREERENIKNQLRAKKKKKSLANEQKFEADTSNRSKRVISNKSAKKQDIAMSDLVAKRAKGGHRKEEIEPDQDEQSDETSGDDDDDEDKGAASDEDETQEHEQPFIFSLTDMHVMQLKRSDLKRYLNKPFFQTMVRGFFVRVGFERRDQKEVYRATKIVGVKETTRTYSFGGISTKKVLTLKYGNFERDYSMEYVSNADIDQAEFDRWMLTITDAGVAPPTREDVELKKINRKEMDEFVFDDQKLNEHLKNNKTVELPSQKNR